MRRHGIQTLASCLTGLLLVSLSTPSASAQCEAPSTWFPHKSTPEPNAKEHRSSNCDFHQWAWQMFLYLTQTTGPDGQLRFETFPTPANLFGSTDKRPVPYDKLPKKKVLRLKPRSAKSSGLTSLDDIDQAGSHGILVDQNGRAVYYSQHINEMYYNFIRDNDYNIPAKYIAAPPTQDFPPGSLELKLSWVIVDQRSEKLYTRSAEIDLLVKDDKGNITIGSTTARVTVGLVGMHIVGVVEGHPEFIWATFEQNYNAPFLPAGTQPSEPVSLNDWRFYLEGALMKHCNISHAGEQSLLVDNQRIVPVSNTFLRYRYGGGTPENQTNIQSLNLSVRLGLDLDPIWNWYNLVGTTWLPDGVHLAPGLDQSGLATGSTSLANSTMETFVQDVSYVKNCLSCHSTKEKERDGHKIPGKNMNQSHIMLDGIFQAMQKEARAKKAARLKE